MRLNMIQRIKGQMRKASGTTVQQGAGGDAKTTPKGNEDRKRRKTEENKRNSQREKGGEGGERGAGGQRTRRPAQEQNDPRKRSPVAVAVPTGPPTSDRARALPQNCATLVGHLRLYGREAARDDRSDGLFNLRLEKGVVEELRVRSLKRDGGIQKHLLRKADRELHQRGNCQDRLGKMRPRSAQGFKHPRGEDVAVGACRMHVRRLE